MADSENKGSEKNVRVDEYDGKRKEGHEGVSEEQKFGTSSNPVQQLPTPWTGLRQVGGNQG